MTKVNYNERSWAIDVISEINSYLSDKSWAIKRAGGENTLLTEKNSLFPDVLIYKDKNGEVILHGWELKMPDTEISNADLLENAIIKARVLNRDSFILWNVKNAVLYVKDSNNKFLLRKSWATLSINKREEVKKNESLWKNQLYTILSDLNNFLLSGEVSDNDSREIISVEQVIDLILYNIPSTIENLTSAIRKDSELEAKINQWWLTTASEYGVNQGTKKESNYKLEVLSKVILTDWVFKFIFANILKRHFNEAREIEKIVEGTSIKEASRIISNISNKCNFWNIFSNNLALEFISDSAWIQIIQLNRFFSLKNIEGIEVGLLHKLLESAILSAKRKVAGQFATPGKLAELLVRLTVMDKDGIVYDPCCGTGTIINHAYLLKEEYKINLNEIVDNLWASDKHSFPIQISTLTLAKSEHIGKILNIFQVDVIDLDYGKEIVLKDPNNGKEIKRTLPRFDYIVSNLPFIRGEEIKRLNPNIYNINQYIKDKTKENITVNKKSDIFAYITFYLHKLLKDDGRVGFVLSNAWLGSDYGKIFLHLFQRFYNIDKVVISGKGKWFNNAEIVTTLLIATKREPSVPIDTDRKISFCTLKESIDSAINIKQISDNILLNSSNTKVSVQTYDMNEIQSLERMGMSWNSYFSNLKWLKYITSKLIGLDEVFKVTRGERRGWNELFYPSKENYIETEYLKPVLRNLRNTMGLFSIPNGKAFCCSKSLEELERLNHWGARDWIRNFETRTNQEGKPLTEVLKRSNLFWYEMKTENMADFVLNVNSAKSLFVSYLKEKSFIDQRMIGLTLKSNFVNVDYRLLLSLMNSLLSMFFIESSGFGRGLAALDLRAEKFKHDFKILNFQLLNTKQKKEIIDAFNPLLNRNRLPLEEEIMREDRIAFELTLFKSFGIHEYYEDIKTSLIDLYKIRFAVKTE